MYFETIILSPSALFLYSDDRIQNTKKSTDRFPHHVLENSIHVWDKAKTLKKKNLILFAHVNNCSSIVGVACSDITINACSCSLTYKLEMLQWNTQAVQQCFCTNWGYILHRLETYLVKANKLMNLGDFTQRRNAAEKKKSTTPKSSSKNFTACIYF